MKTKDHKNLFEDFFHRTLNEQSLIRNEMIGHKIVSIYYAPKVDGWDIDIKDENVFHVPMGFATIQLSNGNYYRINTNYQSWCGGIFGVLIQKVKKEEFTSNRNELDKDYFNKVVGWNIFKGIPIKHVSWNWKTEPQEPNDGKKLELNTAKNYLFENCFVPDNLIFKFENGERIYFFGLEPDVEIVSKGIYSLISGGEELMIFLNKLNSSNKCNFRVKQ